MSENPQSIIKFDPSNPIHATFLRKNVRDFYTTQIADWQYHNRVYNTGLFFIQIRDNIIASQGMIPINLTFNGKVIKTCKSESSFLVPEFRGKGIFEELYFYTIKKSELDDIELIWGFTALSAVWRHKLKFKVFNNIIHESELQLSFQRSVVSTWKSDSSLQSKLKSTIKSAIALIKRKKRNPDGQDEIKTGLVDITEEKQLNSIVALYKKWYEIYPEFICINSSQEYLIWRLIKNPVANYEIIGFYKENELIGFGIINVTESKIYLLDLIVLRKDHLCVCLNKLFDHLRLTKSNSHIIYWASSKNDYTSSIHKLFESMGAFRYVNSNMNFVVKETTKCTNEQIDISNYCINGLWTEGFRI